jgi:hypothetical protein
MKAASEGSLPAPKSKGRWRQLKSASKIWPTPIEAYLEIIKLR